MKSAFLAACLPLVLGLSSCATSGPIPKEAIAAALEMRRNEYRSCYERHLSTKAGSRLVQVGVVRVDFHVDVNGTASRPRVAESSFQNAPFEKCLVEVILGTRFPGSDSGTHYEVSYPFRFMRRTQP